MKKLNLSEAYCTQVGTALGKPMDEVKKIIENLWDRGYTMAEIKRVLTSMAKENGKDLYFVSQHGSN